MKRHNQNITISIPQKTHINCDDLLLVLAVVPVVALMLAGQEVGPGVPLALHEFHEVMGAVVPLSQRQLGQVHLLLGGDHLWQRHKRDNKPQTSFSTDSF